MNRLTYLMLLTAVAIFCSVSAVPVHAQTDAGTVYMTQVTTKKGKRVDKESGTMIVTLAGGNLGQTIALGDEAPMTVIFDNEANTMTTVVTDKKGATSATVMPRIKLGRAMANSLESEYTRTDETKQILGYDARKYIVTSRFGTTEAWLADVPGLGWGEVIARMTGDAGVAKQLMPLADELPNAIALAGVTTSKDGKRVTTMEVTAIKTGADADLSPTQIPAGAEVQDLSKMLGGF